MSDSPAKTTPMMAQWQACKEAAGDALLLFRMGDFYEAFHEDAEVLARVLELTLTQRQGTPMAGVPWHASDGYIDRLVSKGYRVAIAEQTEDPKLTKTLVRREVVRVVTPGSIVTNLAEKDNNFFVAIAQLNKNYGLAVLDLTTGEFRVTQVNTGRALLDELCRVRPAEVLLSELLAERQQPLFAELQQSINPMITTKESWRFDLATAERRLTSHFQLHTLDGLGLNGMEAAITAAGTLLAHVSNDLHLNVDYIQRLLPYSNDAAMQIDRTTQRHLELTEPLHGEQQRQTLLSVLDRTETAMGGRLLRQWVKRPLLDVQAIRSRQACIEAIVNTPLAAAELTNSLQRVRDLERLCMRTCAATASPRDLLALGLSLDQLPVLKAALARCSSAELACHAEAINPMEETAALLLQAISEQPPLRLSEGSAIREGFSEELDELRALAQGHKTWLAEYQAQLRNELGLKTLRVGYNRVFGYYIEVSKGQASSMPGSYSRRQTLTNSERFISPELKAYEEKILTAEERMLALEQQLFAAVRERVADLSEAILSTARAVAKVDCLQGLAAVARERGYVRPDVDASALLQIRGGRHPVVEQGTKARFVPNDTLLDADSQRMLLITGPNMAGKSTYIRQVALLAIMAQIGSFLPAESAHIGLIDRVYTRIGASDDLARGQSTFMVEMTETANILNNATERSLVILDEIGRGTSTYDGVSIAWAVVEHLLTATLGGPKALFATHYLELTQLEESLSGVKNCNIAVKEHKGQVVFLHKIVPGSADRAYGIHVARLAGLPLPVVKRAEELLARLEKKGRKPVRTPRRVSIDAAEIQMTLFSS